MFEGIHLFRKERVVETEIGDAESDEGFDLGEEGIWRVVVGDCSAVVASVGVEHGVGALQSGGVTAELGAEAVDVRDARAGFDELFRKEG